MKHPSSKISPEEEKKLLSNNGDNSQSECEKQHQTILIESNNNNGCHDDNLNDSSFTDKNKIADLLEASPSTNSNSNCCILNVLPINNKNTGSISSIIDESSSKCHFDTVSLCEPCCRVCQCDASEEDLISPCACSGSVKWIHESCLIQWMKSSLKDSCELCTKKIKITKRRKPFTKVCFPFSFFFSLIVLCPSVL